MKREQTALTAETLRTLIRYDPDTGALSWTSAKPACRFAPKREAGHEAGGVDATTGYVQLQLLGRRRLAHRLAWLYVTGQEPEGDIDHINGVRSDNRWGNLRSVLHSTNCENRRAARSDSKTGLLGVQKCSDGREKPFRARIKANGEVIRLGYFASAEEAAEAYIAAKRQHHAGCTI